MKSFFCVTVITALLLISSLPSFSQFRKSRKPKESANFNIQQLAPGVWAAIHNDHYGRAICNAGIVDLGDKTIVFDPFMNPSAGRELKEIAKYLTKKPVTMVVNSNYHNDHIRGSQAFLPTALIISTTLTRGEIERIEPIEQEWERKYAPTLLQAARKRMINASTTEKQELPYWIGYYQGMVESAEELFLALPDMVFNDSFWITGTKRSVKLVECYNGSTISDAVMLIPSAGIAFMGDLLSVDRHPWISDGNPRQWQGSLKRFYEDTLYHTYVPGHGKVSGKEALKDLYEYFDDIQALCDAAKTDAAQNELMLQPVPEAYKDWFFGRFYHPNLEYIISSGKNKSKTPFISPSTIR